ncbi:MAG: hypothetical protein H5U07_04220 [Candidatus Aminicenantes bacterium]|nr:hypothetical protein [Candidatus Aminicenantes bacterium]
MKNDYTQNEKRKSLQVEMKYKKRKIRWSKLALAFVLIFAFFSFKPWLIPTLGQQTKTEKPQRHFYNVDRETTVEGQVVDIKFEARYEGKGHFLILLVKDSSSGEEVEVETAPAWFFQTDIHQGEKIQLIGSLAEEEQGKKVIMAREIKINNRTITLRDRRGFPAWSGGRGRRR